MVEPANGSLIRLLGPTVLRARMSDSDGISSVRFYSGSDLVGYATAVASNEFVLPWTAARNGNYSFHALATDSKGATGKTATVWVSVATNPPSFSVVELEVAPPDTGFDPWAINNRGTVVGAIGTHAAWWKDWDYGTIAVFGKTAIALAINDDGLIVGDFVQIQNQVSIIYQPFLVTVDLSVMQLPGLSYGRASAVSRFGIVGVAQTTNAPGSVGFRYDTTNYTFFNGQPSDINDAGVIVGASLTPSGETFIYGGDETKVLPGAGASAVNRRGQIVGTAGTNAFLYDQGTMSSMGTLGNSHVALDINNDGVGVGYMTRGTLSPFSAFVFHDGVMIELNRLIPPTSGWFLHMARSINDRGWIIGRGSRTGDGIFFQGTGPRGFLLVPGSFLRISQVSPSALQLKAYFADGQGVIESSKDLVQWQATATNANGTAEMSLSLNMDAGSAATFYRVQPLAPRLTGQSR